jgi:hypothetical protein
MHSHLSTGVLLCMQLLLAETTKHHHLAQLALRSGDGFVQCHLRCFLLSHCAELQRLVRVRQKQRLHLLLGIGNNNGNGIVPTRTGDQRAQRAQHTQLPADVLLWCAPQLCAVLVPDPLLALVALVLEEVGVAAAMPPHAARWDRTR